MNQFYILKIGHWTEQQAIFFVQYSQKKMLQKPPTP